MGPKVGHVGRLTGRIPNVLLGVDNFNMLYTVFTQEVFC